MEVYIMIIIALAAVICYCVYTIHKDNAQDNAHIDKLLEDADKSKNNTVKAPWTRK